ncbi:MAG: SRPBCC family protein [Acidobacteriota bacterium]
MSREPFVFEPDLARASTLPSWYYSDPQMLASESERVFGRTWQLVGHGAQLQQAGDYITAVIAGEPVLVVRGDDETIRAMSNVCRHRAGPVATGSGRRKVLQCQYHGWTYTLQGNLHATPEFDGVALFERSSICLPRFRVETWGQLVFVAIDPDVPALHEFLGDIVGDFRDRDFSRYELAARKDWTMDCNWKVYVDNYLEGYHIPIVHPSLFRELDYPNYRTETKRYYSIQHAPVKRPDRIRTKGGQDPQAQYFWVFPNLMLNVYPDNFSTNRIVPLGPEKTLTIFEWYYERSDFGNPVEEMIAFSDEIQLEDINICEAVQRGLRSQTYETGRYSVTRENGVHHFHGLLAEFLGEQPPINQPLVR